MNFQCASLTMKKSVSGRFAPKADRKRTPHDLFFGMAKNTLGSADFLGRVGKPEAQLFF